MTDEIKVYCKDDDTQKDEVLAFFSKRTKVSGEENDYRANTLKNVRLSVGKDGSLILNDYEGEGFIFLYPDQLGHLERALGVALRVCRSKQNEK